MHTLVHSMDKQTYMYICVHACIPIFCILYSMSYYKGCVRYVIYSIFILHTIPIKTYAIFYILCSIRYTIWFFMLLKLCYCISIAYRCIYISVLIPIALYSVKCCSFKHLVIMFSILRFFCDMLLYTIILNASFHIM